MQIVKYNGKVEDYSKTKLQNSIILAFVSNHYDRHRAKEMANQIVKEFATYSHSKTVVTHLDVRSVVAKSIAKYDKNVALLYKKYRELW